MIHSQLTDIDKDANANAFTGTSGTLDVRVRLLIVLLCSVAVLKLNNTIALGVLFASGAVYLAQLKKFKVQLAVYLALTILTLLAALFQNLMGIVIPAMAMNSWQQAAIPFLRGAAIANVVLALALSMRLRGMLTVMKSLRLPRAIYLPLAVSVRFIPGLFDDFKQIRDCLKLRGYGARSIFIPRLWLLPVIFRALHLSDELATAAELKGVGYGKPARLPSPSILTRPTAMAAVWLAVTLACSFGVQAKLGFSMPVMGHGHGHPHGQSSSDDADKNHTRESGHSNTDATTAATAKSNAK